MQNAATRIKENRNNMFSEYDAQVKEFEDILHKIAANITSGILFEHLQPNELWKRAEPSITRLKELAETLYNSASIIKPERIIIIEQKNRILLQTLTTFRDILFQNTTNPSANSRLAFEQLKKAVEYGSDFLILAKEARNNPSPAIEAILKLRELSETKGSIIVIQTPKELQPMLTALINRIEALKTTFTSIEKTIEEAKEELRKLQEESLKFQKKTMEEEKTTKEAKQTTLTQNNFEGDI